jgi:hypothetical protein
MDGVPPATRPLNLSRQESVIWRILEHCWGPTPDSRASASWVLETRWESTFPPTRRGNIESLNTITHPFLLQNVLLEGSNWYALHNPRLPKALMVDLVYEVDHDDAVNLTRYYFM